MPDTFIKIATVTATGSSNSIAFNSIPQTFTDLVIKVSARSTKSGVDNDNFSIQPNGATSTFNWKWLYGTGSSALSTSGTNAFGSLLGTAATATANTFSNAEAYIPNYTSSNFKSMSIDNVNENNATSALLNLVAFTWENTAAITSITIAAGGGNIVQYSTFTLYGIKKN